MQIMHKCRIAVVLGAITASTALAAELRQTSESFGANTFRERSDQLTLIVGTNLAAQRLDDLYIPLPIAVGYSGKGPEIKITPESFTLVDAAGHRYPLAGLTSVRQHYPKLTFDRTVLSAQPLIVGLQFETSQRVAANFFPAPNGGLRTEHVNLAPFMWFTDVLYVERPLDMNGVMTLEFKPQGLDRRLAVKVVVPEIQRRAAATLRH